MRESEFQVNIPQLNTPHLDAQSLAVEISRGAEGTGSRVEVKQDSSSQCKQGDDGWGRKRGEQQLENEVHAAKSAGWRESGRY